MKECPQCKTIKPLENFKSSKLITGYGRYCNECKGHREKPVLEKRPAPDFTDIKCPRCSAQMVVRKRRRDNHKFYGCSRYPMCKGTRTF